MTLYDFLSGAVFFGYLVCALLFLRYWRRTAEPLFLSFALSFLLLGIGQAIQALGNIAAEDRSFVFLFRLAAFLLILVAIFRKNRERLS